LPFPFDPFDPFDPYFQFVDARPSGGCRVGPARGTQALTREIRIERIERMRKRIASVRGDGAVHMERGISLVGN
jgi:hypothetical protein